MNSRCLRVSVLGLATTLVLSCLISGCSGPKDDEPTKEDPGVADSSGNAGNPTLEPGVTKPGGPAIGPGEVGSLKTAPTPPMDKVVITEPATGGWQKSSIDAKELGGKVSKAIAGLTGTLGQAKCYIKTPAGQARAANYYKIQDSKHYRLDYLKIEGLPEKVRGFLLADGSKKRNIVINDKAIELSLNAPLPEAKLSRDKIFERWPRDFTRLMLLPLSDGVDPWSIVLPKLAKGEGGFKTTFEQRTMEFKGRKYNSYRVLAKRGGAAAKKLGACEMEMVIDARRFLPVTIRVVSTDKAGKEWIQQWSNTWDFRQKFKPETFARVD